MYKLQSSQSFGRRQSKPAVILRRAKENWISYTHQRAKEPQVAKPSIFDGGFFRKDTTVSNVSKTKTHVGDKFGFRFSITCAIALLLIYPRLPEVELQKLPVTAMTSELSEMLAKVSVRSPVERLLPYYISVAKQITWDDIKSEINVGK